MAKAEPITPQEAHAELMAFYDVCHPEATKFVRGEVSYHLREALEAIDALGIELRQGFAAQRFAAGGLKVEGA